MPSSVSEQLIGHAEYVAGAAVEKTGEATDSADWKSSGEHRKEEGVHHMRDAAPSSLNSMKTGGSMLGNLEKKAGEMVGCGGMVKEGEARSVGDALSGGGPTSGYSMGSSTGAQPASVDPPTEPASASAAAFDSQKQV